jgi:protein involved in polysaccharide export with SLBB domain
MRVTRSFMLLLAIGFAAAGCASQPVAYVQMAPPNGIDNVAYGTPAARAPTYPPGYTYAPGYAYPAAANNAYQPGVNYAQQAGASYAYQPGATYAAPATTTYGSPAGAGYASGYYNSAAGTAPGYAAAAQSPYTLDSGDRLRIVVFGQDGLTNSYAVDASGHIAMPLIGPVLARGATTDELSSRIGAKLRDGFVREPHVAVEIEAYRPFFILGEVTAPGQYPYIANMTAETAVAIAGGFGPRAVRQSVIVNRTYNGQQQRMSVPLTYPLRPGDTVNVQERWF